MYLHHIATTFAPRQVFGGTDYPYAIMQTRLGEFLDATRLGDADVQSLRHGAARRFLGVAG